MDLNVPTSLALGLQFGLNPKTLFLQMGQKDVYARLYQTS